jgi:hypothetical protein
VIEVTTFVKRAGIVLLVLWLIGWFATLVMAIGGMLTGQWPNSASTMFIVFVGFPAVICLVVAVLSALAAFAFWCKAAWDDA